MYWRLYSYVQLLVGILVPFFLKPRDTCVCMFSTVLQSNIYSKIPNSSWSDIWETSVQVLHVTGRPQIWTLRTCQYRAGDRKCTWPKDSKKQGITIHMWCIPASEHLEQAHYMAGERKCTLLKDSKKQVTPLYMWWIAVSENFKQAQQMAGDRKCTLRKDSKKSTPIYCICDALRYLNT